MAVQPISAVGHEEQDEGQYSSLLAQSLKKQEESRATLSDMIRDAREKADAQREKFKLAKATPRYGDAPLEATPAGASPSWRPPSVPTPTTPTRSRPPSAS